jgi:hypothetical protein
MQIDALSLLMKLFGIRPDAAILCSGAVTQLRSSHIPQINAGLRLSVSLLSNAEPPFCLLNRKSSLEIIRAVQKFLSATFQTKGKVRRKR